MNFNHQRHNLISVIAIMNFIGLLAPILMSTLLQVEFWKLHF